VQTLRGGCHGGGKGEKKNAGPPRDGVPRQKGGGGSKSDKKSVQTKVQEKKGNPQGWEHTSKIRLHGKKGKLVPVQPQKEKERGKMENPVTATDGDHKRTSRVDGYERGRENGPKPGRGRNKHRRWREVKQTGTQENRFHGHSRRRSEAIGARTLKVKYPSLNYTKVKVRSSGPICP